MLSVCALYDDDRKLWLECDADLQKDVDEIGWDRAVIMLGVCDKDRRLGAFSRFYMSLVAKRSEHLRSLQERDSLCQRHITDYFRPVSGGLRPRTSGSADGRPVQLSACIRGVVVLFLWHCHMCLCRI